MSKKAQYVAQDVVDRLAKCGGCGHQLHVSTEYRGPVEAVRCFNCTEYAAKQMGIEPTDLRDEMRSIRHVGQLPLGWKPSKWVHARTGA